MASPLCDMSILSDCSLLYDIVAVQGAGLQLCPTTERSVKSLNDAAATSGNTKSKPIRLDIYSGVLPRSGGLENSEQFG